MNEIITLMSRALDASALRQKSISNNIANADTPNFKPTRVIFDDVLQQEIKSKFVAHQTSDKHVPIGAAKASLPKPKVVIDNQVYRNNENGVDLDYQMTELSKNSI